LIPLELGGSNSSKNLWPESHRTSPWNAQVKDRHEGKLHALVCAGRLDLRTAQQQAIASKLASRSSLEGFFAHQSRFQLWTDALTFRHAYPKDNLWQESGNRCVVNARASF
jgi:hypothetical protein